MKRTEERIAALYDEALSAEKAGRTEAAGAAYRTLLDLDPEDHVGAAVRLAALGQGPVPERAPEAYVATLFDQHAEAFDDILVEQLGYAVPMLLRERIDALGLGPFARVLDLGCGTGLAGASLRDRAEHLTGIDLAETMVMMADRTGAYHDLYVGEAVAFLEEGPGEPWDLIVATDTLPYLGDLAPFLAGAAARMAPKGVLALSSETLGAEAFGGQGWTVGPRHRFAHARSYLTEALSAAGFSVIEMEPITVRAEEDSPVPGFLILARAP
ncbi:MAG: methyltransferase domain-containing protein [Pseudomonadota bacterium]